MSMGVRRNSILKESTEYENRFRDEIAKHTKNEPKKEKGKSLPRKEQCGHQMEGNVDEMVTIGSKLVQLIIPAEGEHGQWPI